MYIVCQRYSSTVNGKAQSRARLHSRPHSSRGTADQHNLLQDIHALLPIVSWHTQVKITDLT
jgi:hypothetical protein